MTATAPLRDAYRIHAASGTDASVDEAVSALAASPVEGSVHYVTYQVE